MPLSATTATLQAWQCADNVLLQNSDASHVGVGLASGRLFRDPPGECNSDIPGVLRGGTGWQAFLFSNLDTPLGCPMELIFFFDEFAPLVHQPPRDAVTWNYGLNHVIIDVLPADELVAITGTVWFEGGAGLYDIHQDTMTTRMIYGDEYMSVRNRGGMKFEWTVGVPMGTETEFHDLLTSLLAPACTRPSDQFVTPGAVNVYYISTDYPDLAVHQGHSCHDTMDAETFYIIVSADPLFSYYSGTALPHHLGHVLSLTDVTGLGTDNVMSPTGLNGRIKLSLGQVFRMHFNPHSWVNVSTLSPRIGRPTRDCDDLDGDSVVDPCPGITVFVP